MQKLEQHHIIENLEEHAENLIKKTRKYLPTIGKTCVLATFIEDGTRLITRSQNQFEYLGKETFSLTFRSFIVVDPLPFRTRMGMEFRIH